MQGETDHYKQTMGNKQREFEDYAEKMKRVNQLAVALYRVLAKRL